MELLGLQNLQGEIAALSAAGLWAVSAVIYGKVGVKIPPLHLNFLKGAIALVLLALTLIFLGASIEQLNPRSTSLLLLSGVVGIGLGDTAFFKSLKVLGARRTLLLETLSAPLSALLAFAFLGEQLGFGAWCGILLTILGVAWVISERTRDITISAIDLKRGLFWGLLAQISQASGTVLSRSALADTSVSPIWSSLLRIAAGVVVVLLLLARNSQNENFVKVKWSAKAFGAIALAAFCGTYLAMMLQQTALKYSPAGIAQTLISTSPIFVLPMAAVMGEKVSLRAILGVFVAIAGISLLFR